MEITNWTDLKTSDNVQLGAAGGETPASDNDCMIIEEADAVENQSAEADEKEESEKDWQDFVVLSYTCSGNSKESVNSTANSNNMNSKQTSNTKPKMSSNTKPKISTVVKAPVQMNEWSDANKFDGGFEEDWYSIQEKKLAAQYGGNFIKVKHIANGRVSFFCELCLAECNAKKALDEHCNGMKHLRKKDLFKKEGKQNVDSANKNSANGKESTRGVRGRYADRGSRRSPPSNRFREDRRPRENRDRSRSGRNRSRSRERERSRERRRRNSRERGGLRSREDRGAAGLRSREDRGTAGLRSREDRGTADGSSSDAVFYGYNHLKPNDVEPRQERFQERDNFNFSEMDHYDSAPQQSPPRNMRDLGDSIYKPEEYTDQYSFNYQESQPIPPSPPRFVPDSMDKTPITSSSIGSMLMKLAKCCVKTPEDADFAVNVVTILTKSLKEYSQKKGESKIVEILSDAEVKLGTAKALKVGMKMLSNFTGDPNFKSASAIATEYMTNLSNQMPERSINPAFNINNTSNQNLNQYNNNGYHQPANPQLQSNYRGNFNPSEPPVNLNWNN